MSDSHAARGAVDAEPRAAGRPPTTPVRLSTSTLSAALAVRLHHADRLDSLRGFDATPPVEDVGRVPWSGLRR